MDFDDALKVIKAKVNLETTRILVYHAKADPSLIESFLDEEVRTILPSLRPLD